MTTTTTTPPAAPVPAPIAVPAGRDRSTYAGMLAVAVAAAVLSFSALAGLAELAGVSGAVSLPGGARFRLAWLLPIAVDAYAVTATRVWLRTAGTPRTRGYARRNAIGAIALSVVGNAVYHALIASGLTSLTGVRAGWVVVVAVSAVPPVMLGLVGHLHALVSEDHRPAPAPVPPSGPIAEGHALADSLAAARAAERAAARGPDVPPTGRPPRTGTHHRTRTGSRAGTRTGGRAPVRTDAELTAALAGLPREPDGTVPIRRATAALGCGPDRARRLLAGAGLLRTPATTTTAELTPAATTDPAGATAPIAA